MEYVTITIVVGVMVFCRWLCRIIKKRDEEIDRLKNEILSCDRAIEQLRYYIVKENRAKMEFHRTLAQYPGVAAVIRKVQYLESQVASLRRLLELRMQRHVYGNN